MHLDMGAMSVQTSWSLSLLTHPHILMKHHCTKHAGEPFREALPSIRGMLLLAAAASHVCMEMMLARM